MGVEHLLRDINDPSVSTLANQIKHKMSALGGLKDRLEEMQSYLQLTLSGELQPSNQIVYNMQNVFNLLPNLNVEELVRSMLVKTNDMHLVIYVSSLIRSIIALHDLVLNKIKYAGIDDEDDGAKENGKRKQKPAVTPSAAAAEAGERGMDVDESSSKRS